MPNTILIKKSGTTNAVPSTLNFGELAINYADGKLYYKNSAGTIVALAGTASEIVLNVDGGHPDSVYGGLPVLDGGGV